MRELTFAILIAFASYRAWALIALDEISRPIRSKIFSVKTIDKRLHRWAFLWLSCPWCAGTWITAVITILTDKITTEGVPSPVLVFAAAAAGTALLGVRDERLMESQA